MRLKNNFSRIYRLFSHDNCRRLLYITNHFFVVPVGDVVFGCVTKM